MVVAIISCFCMRMGIQQSRERYPAVLPYKSVAGLFVCVRVCQCILQSTVSRKGRLLGAWDWGAHQEGKWM